MSETPEQLAREHIDALLIAAGWVIQDYRAFNPGAARGIALREVPLESGRCDYLLLVDRLPLGVIEAKKEGTTLSTVSEQSAHCGENLPDFLANLLPGTKKIPFAYESTGVETLFRDERDPQPRSRRVFAFHQPATLAAWLFYAQGVKANGLFYDRKPAADKKAWTEKLWIYDLRTNQHFTLNENTLKRSDLDDFVGCYFGRVGKNALGSTRSTSRHDRKESERFKRFTYDELIKRDKVNFDIFWLKDDALEDSANLPAPSIIAADIVADLEAALEQFAAIEEDLKP